ncbi:MAG: sterol desaturase family protein [Pseudomonadota bacterium]
MEYFQELGQQVVSLATYPVDPNKRIFWGYLLSAVFLAFIVFFISVKKKQPQQSFLKFLLPHDVWWNASARLDYKMFIVNKIAKAIFIAPFLLTMPMVALSIIHCLEFLFGTTHPIILDPVVITIIFTLALFICDDLTRFLLHYMLHKIPWLWCFHKVHHSAEVLTPMTIYRSHPVENLLYAWRMTMTQGFVVGVSYYLFGTQIQMLDIIGANMFTFAFNILGSNLRHSHIWLRFGPTIEKWFISPAQHQVHHSLLPKHFDKNFGTFLAVWDRWAGSLVTAEKERNFDFGISKKDFQSHQSLVDIYYQPFKEVFYRFDLVKEKLKSIG